MFMTDTGNNGALRQSKKLLLMAAGQSSTSSRCWNAGSVRGSRAVGKSIGKLIKLMQMSFISRAWQH